MANVNLPEASVDLIAPGTARMAKPWYQMMAAIANAQNAVSNATGTANTMPGNFTGAEAADARHTKAEIKSWLALVPGDVSGLATVASSGDVADLTGAITWREGVSGIIELPDVKTYNVVCAIPFDCTIKTFSRQTAAGSCTLRVNNNGVNVGSLGNGAAITANTTLITTTATSNQAVSAGDYLLLNIVTVSSCEGLSFVINVERSLAL